MKRVGGVIPSEARDTRFREIHENTYESLHLANFGSFRSGVGKQNKENMRSGIMKKVCWVIAAAFGLGLEMGVLAADVPALHGHLCV